MTGVSVAGASTLEPPLPELRIQILHVADCPLVGRVRQDLQEFLGRAGIDALIEELEGRYPSPTLLVGGRDVTERPPGAGPACRLDLPSRDQISRAIKAAVALADDRAGDCSARAEVEHHAQDTNRLADKGAP
jgi:hypothetical protein